MIILLNFVGRHDTTIALARGLSGSNRITSLPIYPLPFQPNVPWCRMFKLPIYPFMLHALSD